MRKGALPPWDRQACHEATPEDLDLLALRDTLQRMGLGPISADPERFLSDTVSLSAFVPTLLVREPMTRTLRPRNFAMLLFGRDLQRFVPGAVAYFSRYEGLDRAAARGERLELSGTLLEQLRVMLSAALSESRTLFDKRDARHPSVLKYPPEAIREAVVNAFVHRDYTRVDPLRVTAFADRLEILSPGGLPLGVDAAALARGEAPPVWRNQALAWFASRLGLAEAEGQGLRTIQSSLDAAGCAPATLQADSERVVCTLRAHPRATL